MATVYELFTNPAVFGLGSAALGALSGFIAAKVSKPHDLQNALNGTVKELIDGFHVQLEQANSALARQSEALKQADSDRVKMGGQLEELRSTVGCMGGQLTDLNAYILELTTLLERNGIQVPPHPLAPGQSQLQLEGT